MYEGWASAPLCLDLATGHSVKQGLNTNALLCTGNDTGVENNHVPGAGVKGRSRTLGTKAGFNQEQDLGTGASVRNQEKSCMQV